MAVHAQPERTARVAGGYRSLHLPSDFTLVGERRTNDPDGFANGSFGLYATMDRFYATPRSVNEVCEEIPQLLAQWVRDPDARVVHRAAPPPPTAHSSLTCWFGGTVGRYEMSGSVSVLHEVPASSETLYATPITVSHNAVLRLSLTDFN